MLYKGIRHCGRVAYEVESEIGGVIECNCSINVRCLEGVDPHELEVQAFDGRAL